MSMRFTPDQAVSLGIISKDDARSMNQNARRGRAALQQRINKTLSTTQGQPKTRAAAQLEALNDPQTILYNALVARLPAGAVKWEVPNLIKGRNLPRKFLMRQAVPNW